MYKAFFNLTEDPFSITPDPRFLFLSRRHQEALAHLLFSMRGASGFILLTGEVGTGKTTLSRCLIEQLPPQTDLALIFNPRLTAAELVLTICDELKIPYPQGTTSLKVLVDVLNRHLLESHTQGRATLLVLDEAQNLSPELLEQVRLLTNLETATRKLLQIILIGQPELGEILAKTELRQLSQRVTARYHISPLSPDETWEYIHHRLAVAGCPQRLFSHKAIQVIHHAAGGIPRMINKICDRALLGAYTLDRHQVDAPIARQAAREVLGERPGSPGVRTGRKLLPWLGAAALLLAGIGLGWHAPAWPVRTFLATVFSPPATSALEPPPATPALATPPATPALATPPATPQENLIIPSPGGAPVISPPTEPPSPPASPGDGTPLPIVEPTPPLSETPPSPTVAAPAPADQEPDLDVLLADPARSLDYASAMVTLLQQILPGRAFPTGANHCSLAQMEGLACLNTTGNWGLLKLIGVPVALRLTSPAWNARFLVVLAVEGDSARVRLDGEELTLPRSALERFWFGRLHVIWRPPQQPFKVLKKGMRGEEVRWLRSALDRRTATISPPAEGDLFDGELEQRLRDFQWQHGLEPDGIAGALTFLILSSTPSVTPAPQG